MRNAVWTRGASANRVAIFGALACGAGCPARTIPASPTIADATLEIGRDGVALRGAAADLEQTYAVLGGTLEARRGRAIAWTANVGGSGGPVVRASTLVVVATGGSGGNFHGEPGAAIAAFEAATGKPAWRVELATTDYVIATALAAVPGAGGAIVGGTFGGTLRAGDRVVASAGASDGFVARIDDTGHVAWLARLGGNGADTVVGVAATADRALFAGTFTAGAELGGKPLAAFNERSVLGDAVVGAFDLAGKPAWVTTFGGKSDDAIAGLAVDGRGRVAVAGTLRETVHVGGQDLVAQGRSDALVAWWSAQDGAVGGALRLGGQDVDSATAIVGLAAGGFVVAGDFSARVELARDDVFVAGGGDDAFVAHLGSSSASGPNGLEVVGAWHVGGEGREDVVALGAAPGGFVAAVAHTAKASFGGAALPSPRDPLAGAALVTRAVR